MMMNRVPGLPGARGCYDDEQGARTTRS